MKANEAKKSKFVYPDKLYARTKDNITLDISYAPQTMEAVEYVRTDAFVEKVYKWLSTYAFVDDDKNVHLPTLLHDFLKDSRTF
jgi:hypothetical protein